MVDRPDGAALRRLQEAVARSKRHSTVGLPTEFVRDRVGDPPSPPLKRLVEKKRFTQLRVYLLMLMMATEYPHTTERPAYDVATMLGLGESKPAQRRVQGAFNGLAGPEHKLIKREPVPGLTTRTTILHPCGDGSDWDSRSLRAPYVTLPISLWKNGWVIALSGRALSLFIILKELTGGREGDSAWADGLRKLEYGVSEETWHRGSLELVEAGLLTLSTTVKTVNRQRRKRNEYTLHLDVLDKFVAGEVPESLRARVVATE